MPARTSGATSWSRLDAAWEGIGLDRTSGASRLGERTLAAFARLLRSTRRMPPGDLRRQLLPYVRRLRRIQPALGALTRWSRELAQTLRSTPARGLRPRLSRWVARERRRLRHELGAVVRTAEAQFPPAARVLTISRSEAVLRVLRALPPARRPREILALRSDPGGEGRRLVGELRRSGLRARLVPDHDLARALEEADLVLVGADAIYSGGTLVHKTGTRRLSQAARAAGVPVLVVSGLSKYVEGPAPPKTRLPRLFDVTPGRLLSGFWTDRGLMKPNELAGRAIN